MGPWTGNNRKEGFVILNRFGEVYSRTLYKDIKSARDDLLNWGFDEEQIEKVFKIVPAHFEIETAELEVEA